MNVQDSTSTSLRTINSALKKLRGDINNIDVSGGVFERDGDNIKLKELDASGENFVFGVDSTTESGYKLVFIGEDSDTGVGAFRVGQFTNGAETAPIGLGSVAMGVNNKAEATYSSVLGGRSNVIDTSGVKSVIGGGNLNKILDSETSVISGGLENDISGGGGSSSIGGGQENKITDSAKATVSGGDKNKISGANLAYIGGGLANEITGSTNTVICGGDQNKISNSGASVICGGNQNDISGNSSKSFIGSGGNNNITNNSDYSFIGSGNSNEITINSEKSFIGSGSSNNITNNSIESFIGSGSGNDISGNSLSSFIGSGSSNNISSSSSDSFIGSGSSNNISSNSDRSFIGSGSSNNISSNSSDSFIGSGSSNNITNNSVSSAIIGGSNNDISGGSVASTILGGNNNDISGNYSIACGQNATVSSSNSFLWTDGTAYDLSGNRTFQVIIGTSGSSSARFTNESGVGVFFNSGSGVWDSTSDRNKKENIVEVNYDEILKSVDNIPIYEYNMINGTKRSIGPMAQDWYEQLDKPMLDTEGTSTYTSSKSGEELLSLGTIDLDGVALGAIKGLLKEIKDLKTRIEILENST